MTAYIESAKQVGRLENAIGWYHSHPGRQIYKIYRKALPIDRIEELFNYRGFSLEKVSKI